MEFAVQHAFALMIAVVMYTLLLVTLMWVYYKKMIAPKCARKAFVLKQIRHALSTRVGIVPDDLMGYCTTILNDIEAASTMRDKFHNQYTYGKYKISALWYPSFGSFCLRLDDTYEKVVEVNFPT